MYYPEASTTAFICEEGHYEFLVLPFGVKNGSTSIQRCMENLLKEFLYSFVVVYHDNIDIVITI